MVKYHINKRGIPSICQAKSGNCPLGKNQQHFETEKDAQDYIDKQNASKHELLPGSPSELDTPTLKQLHKISKLNTNEAEKLTENIYNKQGIIDSLNKNINRNVEVKSEDEETYNNFKIESLEYKAKLETEIVEHNNKLFNIIKKDVSIKNNEEKTLSSIVSSKNKFEKLEAIIDKSESDIARCNEIDSNEDITPELARFSKDRRKDAEADLIDSNRKLLSLTKDLFEELL